MKLRPLILDDRISTSRLRRAAPEPPPPAYVRRFFERIAGMSSIFVGNVCNQRCIYCDTERDELLSLRAAEARARIERMADLGVRRLMFVGGEPTIWRPLRALIEHARVRGIPDVFIATNGLMLAYEPYLRSLREAGLTGVELSLDDFEPQTQRRLSDNDRAGDLLGRALEGLLGHPELHLFLLAVVTRLNRPHLEAYLDGLAVLGQRRSAPVPAVLTHLKPLAFAYANRDTLVEPLRVTAPALVAALRSGVERGLEIIIKEVPPCQLPGSEAYTWEANLEELCLDLDGGELPSVQSPLLAKHQRCRSCRFDGVCAGVYRKYTETFGWDEIQPVPGGDETS